MEADRRRMLDADRRYRDELIDNNATSRKGEDEDDFTSEDTSTSPPTLSSSSSSSLTSSQSLRKRIECFYKKAAKKTNGNDKKTGSAEPSKDLLVALDGIMALHDCIVGVDPLCVSGTNELCYLIPAACEKGITVVLYPHKSEIAPFQDNDCSLTFLRERAEKHSAMGVPTAIWGDKDGMDKLIQDLTGKNPKTRVLYVLGLRCVRNGNFLEVINKIHQAGYLQRFCVEKIAYLRDNWEALEVVQMLRKNRAAVPLLVIANTASLEESQQDEDFDFEEFAAEFGDNLEMGKTLQMNTFIICPNEVKGRKNSLGGKVAEEEVLHTCNYCFHVGPKETLCTLCSEVYYCDRACQKAGWVTHKDKCRHFVM